MSDVVFYVALLIGLFSGFAENVGLMDLYWYWCD